MDNSTLIIFLLIGSIFIFMVGAIFLIPFADGMKIEMLGKFHAAPTLCYIDSNYNNHIEEAILIWELALWDLWKEDGLFPYILITQENHDVLLYCDIILLIINEEYTNQEVPLGTTFTFGSDGYIYIYIFEQRPSIDLEHFNASIIRTTMHEIGHGFGLNHWIPENTKEGLEKPDILMWEFQWYSTPIIDKYTLKAMECLYGDSGFSGRKQLSKCFEFRMPLFDERDK